MRNIIRILLPLSLCVPTAFAGGVSREDARLQLRKWVMSHARHEPLAPAIAPRDNDLAANLVDELRFDNLADMEAAGLLTARLERLPWSSSYWPIYAGELANRYGDPEYNPSVNWRENEKFLLKSIGRGDNKNLSPAEKYDLLVGDTAFTLTKRMIEAGAPYAERDGTVPTWFGICHGWSPASFMENRPVRVVRAKAADGRELEFYPTDIKALATLLWANGAGETRFIGGRCNEPSPVRDSNGRETNPDCFDTNPATWHLAVVNQIGVAKRGFVADIAPGAEVWNQPAIGYKYFYVNPITGATEKKLADARVRFADWTADPYHATRSPDAVAVVKIVMSFEYGAETQASAVATDGPEYDARGSQIYTYDLELDAHDRIVGGEWYSSAHPDFLWTPVKGSRATSAGDDLLDRQGDHAGWKVGEPIPRAWRSAAKAASGNEQPLARIVKGLLDAAD
jgi:hypothetical protein